MIFMDNDHAQRWAAAIQTAGAVRDDDTVKGDFGASLYILTGLPSVYDRVEKHIHHSYIDFEPMLHMGLSTGETILVALAGNLYNGGFFGGGDGCGNNSCLWIILLLFCCGGWGGNGCGNGCGNSFC